MLIAGQLSRLLRGLRHALLSRLDQTPEVYGLPLGALDDDPGVRPSAHCHVADRAPWFEITDDLPRHEGALEAAAESNP